MSVAPAKRDAALDAVQRWARGRGLVEREIEYVSRTRDRRRLRFSESGEPGVERMYRTHWISPDLSERKRERLVEKQRRPPDLVVVMPLEDSDLYPCRGSGGMPLMEGDGPL